MREILFRGKRIDNGEWVYGVPTKDTYGETVIVESVFECDEYACRGANCLYVGENTISEFTGLTDKNGKKIFEGDIVKHCNNSDDGFDIGALYWDETFSQWRRTSIGDFHHSGFNYMMSHFCDYEVIGNIHDNPELLKGGEG